LTETTAPNLNQVFWTNSGAEATEGAIKLAKVATGRPAIIAFRHGFHGRTHAAMAVTSSRVKVRGHYEPLIPSVYFAPFPYLFRSPYKGAPEDADLYYFAELEALFDQLVMPDDVAGILIETVVGEGGYLVPTKRWLQKVRELCDKHGILLVCDEVQSGMGRSGTMWAIEQEGISPDIITAGKGIASGLPLGAMIARDDLMKWELGAHGSTYGGSPLSCAAALATFDVIEQERLLDNAKEVGELFEPECCSGIRGRHAVGVPELGIHAAGEQQLGDLDGASPFMHAAWNA